MIVATALVSGRGVANTEPSTSKLPLHRDVVGLVVDPERDLGTKALRTGRIADVRNNMFRYAPRPLQCNVGAHHLPCRGKSDAVHVMSAEVFVCDPHAPLGRVRFDRRQEMLSLELLNRIPDNIEEP